MEKFNANKKLAEILDLMGKTPKLDNTFMMLEFHSTVRKILTDCYNKGVSDSFETGNKPRITKTN